MTKQQQFIKRIADMEPGQAPSVGYMEDLILHAREVLEDKHRSNPDADKILQYMNLCTGRRFRPNKANLAHINVRLNEGISPTVLMQIIELKTFQWKDSFEMRRHLNPETLFRASKIDKYIQEVEDVKNNPQAFKQYAEQKLNKQQPGCDPLDSMYN